MKLLIVILLNLLTISNIKGDYSITSFINELQEKGIYDILVELSYYIGCDVSISLCKELYKTNDCETVIRVYIGNCEQYVKPYNFDPDFDEFDYDADGNDGGDSRDGNDYGDGSDHGDDSDGSDHGNGSDGSDYGDSSDRSDHGNSSDGSDDCNLGDDSSNNQKSLKQILECFKLILNKEGMTDYKINQFIKKNS